MKYPELYKYKFNEGKDKLIRLYLILIVLGIGIGELLDGVLYYIIWFSTVFIVYKKQNYIFKKLMTSY